MSDFFSLFDKPAAQPAASKLTLTSPTAILDQYLSQGSKVPALNDLATTLNTDANKDLQQQVSAVDPSLMGNLAKFGVNTTSMLAGNIPQDVIDKVTRNDAYQSLMGGFGSGSGMGKSLSARDFGLTSLDMMQKGAGNLSLEDSLAQSLAPSRFTAGGMLLTPASLQNADYTVDQFNNGIDNQNALINYKNSMLQSPFQQLVNGALGNTFSAVLNAPANMLNSYTSGSSWMGGSGVGGSDGFWATTPDGKQEWVPNSVGASGSGSNGSNSAKGGGGLMGMLGGGGGLLSLMA